MNKLSTYLFATITLITSLTLSNEATANPVNASISPYTTIETVGNNLFGRIAQNKQEIEKFPDVMRDIVDEELMPYVDYKYSAYKILGKNLKNTTPEQRNKFVTSVRTYLIRTYANALAQYNNQEVVFEKDRPTNGKKIVSVNTQIINPNQSPIDIAFKLRKNKKTNQWKAYDMVVEGISLLDSKKAELTRRISKQGVEKVTMELAYTTK